MGSKTPYFEIFQARNRADGDNFKDQITQLSRRNFQRFMRESPNTVDLLKGQTAFRGVILSNKQDEFRLTKQLLTEITFPIAVGDLIQWDEGFWLVFKIEQDPIEDYRKSFICRCNHLLKWIDRDGVKREQWVYEFSSKETMIRATFKSRVQHVLASEMNKFMEVIMPYTDRILREQRFIIDGEAWYVIEHDSSSAKGITYITLGEDKKDPYGDDLISEGDSEDLANITELNKTKIVLPISELELPANTTYTIQPIAMKEDKVVEGATFDFYVRENRIAENTATCPFSVESDSTVVIQLYGKPDIKTVLKFRVTETAPTSLDEYLLIGDDRIKWGRSADYLFVHRANGETISDTLATTFSISKPELATLTILDKDSCLLTANSKRMSGSLVLTAKKDGVVREKAISIVSLW